jgi:protoheme IX farnesyltransferase
VLLVLLIGLPACGGLFGTFYLVSQAVLGVAFLAMAFRLFRTEERRHALQMYLFSLAFLALLFASMVVDARVFA